MRELHDEIQTLLGELHKDDCESRKSEKQVLDRSEIKLLLLSSLLGEESISDV